MGENSRSGKPDNKSPETKFRHALYVPEEQLFQRIPLCLYLSDLSALFENENTVNDESTEIAERNEQP